jgi:general secretion pathway protein D
LTSNGSFSGTVTTGQVTLSASASASNNQVNVLSTPRIVARSGAEATVQVGTDVPIITSQRAANSQSGGNTDVLQTVQYRSTGVLLSVTPRVYSGNRIDLEISQETSAAEANSNSSISSPLISTRSLNSQLSLQDGQTAVLGGLIENRFTRGNNGIPIIKDVPILGAPFRSETLNATRTMLVVLVTPFVLDTRNDRQQVVDTLVRALNSSFDNQTRANGTLLPPNQPFQIRAAGGADTTALEPRED